MIWIFVFLIPLAYEILTEKKQASQFKDILDEIARLNGVTTDDLRSRISQFYTDLNVDGRFLCVGENQWGLRLWYPFEQSEDEIIVAPKVKKKKGKKVVIDDFEDIDEIAENEFILEDEEDAFDDVDEIEDEEEEFIEDVIGPDLDEVDDVDDLDEELIVDELPLEIDDELVVDEDEDLLEETEEEE
ncbi:MAG: DNA-directed polymerase subunit delta [Bacillales bacterium]|nr:DNA-directed polymerase subunit delta [Bacillales bacterium]